MNELEANADSVNFLITKLCESISHGLHNPNLEKLRSLSFEILLKKRSRHQPDITEDYHEFDPLNALDVQIFSAKMNASKRQLRELEKITKFEDELNAIMQDTDFTTNDTCKRLLQLLLALQGNICNDEQFTHERLLVPGPFTLHGTYNKNPHFPFGRNECSFNAGPQYFKGVTRIQTENNPYMPKCIQQPYRYKKRAEDLKERAETMKCSFTEMTARLCGMTRSKTQIASGPFNIFTRFMHTNAKALQENRLSEGEEPQCAEPVTTQPERIRLFSWESLGYCDAPKPLPFSTEANVALHLMSYHNSQQNKQFKASILSPEQFLTDLKSLTVGIQSETFTCDDLLIFHMVPNVTVSDILPATVQNYVVDFLECGTCYKRLMTMIMKRDYQLMFEGFIFKALCKAIDEYLLTMRQFVFGYQDSYLMGYYKRVKKMMKQTVNLSLTLGIHPNVQDNVQPPLGSQFLGYIYREIVRLTDMDFITLLVYILRRCCQVYFKHLQKWIFYGVLDDPSNELFICFVDNYRQFTKYHYDKAYYVRNESVPGFLQNYENQLLKCGKYTMLLKACKPNHPLFDLECPSISVCVSFAEIQRLERECIKYYHRAIEVCGKPLTLRALFESRAERKTNFLDMVSLKWRHNMDRWSEEQRVVAEKRAEMRKKRLAVLSQQLEEMNARKVAERRANVENELLHLRQLEKLEDKRLLVENVNLRKRIEYYQEMSDTLREESKGPHRRHDPLRLDIPAIEGPSANLSPRTPCSNNDTDFESCNGDDDAASMEYLDCLTSKPEKCVPELYQSTNSLEHEPIGDADSQTSGMLKRSASDVINSNEETATAKTALAVSSARAAVGRTEPSEYAMPLTPFEEARRNKMKVMAHEYGLLRDNVRTKSMPDINLNTVPDDQLTDLQRNRRRAMQDTWHSSECDPPPHSQRTQLTLDLETDLERNRRKVLESEFHIVTGERTTPVQPHAPDTPMSTTSDTPLTESAKVCTALCDEENGNLMKKSSTTTYTVNTVSSNAHVELPIVGDPEEQMPDKLKLNVQLAMGDSTNAEEHVPSTAQTDEQPTPDTALNTAGLMAKQGFPFAAVDDSRRVQNDLPFHSELNSDASASCSANSEPYQRCMELLKSNFKCAPQSPFIRLNKVANVPKEENFSGILESIEARRRAHRTPLNSISVITLTDFLQKSVIIPMHTHLELVNNEVMRMFLDDLDILKHLRSLRKYFLLMDGEFGAIICDGIIGQLEGGEAPQKLLNYQMLHSILDAALGSSRAGYDKNAENLSFIVSDVPEQFDLSSPNVLDVLSLSYTTEWPLNLILNPDTLAQYAKVFRYLLQVRRISWVLERAYQLLKEAVKENGSDILKSPQYRHVQLIRHKFYHFVHALSNHITANALEASWKQFKDDLLSAICIEDIYRKHAAYMKRIMFLCMLNRKSVDFYNNIDNIFKISLRFYNNLKSRPFKQKKDDEHFTHARYAKIVADEMEFDKFIKFTIYMGNKIVKHGYQEEIGEFISLINYNHYYTTK